MSEGSNEIRRQVSSSDPIYREKIARSQEASKERVFGRDAIELGASTQETVDRIRQIKGSLEADLANTEDQKEIERIRHTIQYNADIEKRTLERQKGAIRAPFEEMAWELNELLNFCLDEDQKEFAESQVVHMFSGTDQQAELKKHFGEDLSGFTALNLAVKIADNSLSDELLFAAARRHDEQIKKQEHELERLTEQAKKEFKEAVQRHVAEGTLPVSAMENLERVDDVVVRITDQLLRLKSPVLGEIDQARVIRIGNGRLHHNDQEGLRRIFFHELTHAIAGESIDIQTGRLEHGYEFNTVQLRKTGVELRRESMIYSPNRWLNEAITEWIALQLSGYARDTGEDAYEGSKAYPHERQELDRLFAAGLTEDEVLQAYFENFTADKTKGEGKGKYYGALLRRINEIEGPHGFTKLENQQLMSEIQEKVRDYGIYPPQKEREEREDPDVEQFRITISVGKRGTEIEQPFIFKAKPMKRGEEALITTTEQWEAAKGDLSALLKRYGRKASFQEGYNRV